VTTHFSSEAKTVVTARYGNDKMKELMMVSGLPHTMILTTVKLCSCQWVAHQV